MDVVLAVLVGVLAGLKAVALTLKNRAQKKEGR